MSFLDRLFGGGSAAETLNELDRIRREQQAVWDLEEVTREQLEAPGLSPVERIRLRQAADRAYWDMQWQWAVRQTKRNWR